MTPILGEDDIRSGLVWWPGHGFVPPIFGAEGDQEEETEDEETEEETEEEETEDDPKKKLDALTETKNRLVAKLGKREKALKKAQADIKALQDAGKQPDEKITEELNNLRTRVPELLSDIERLKVENEILTNEKLAPLPSRRRKIIVSAIMPEYEVDDDGDSNLNELLDQLEKDDPDLFKTVSSNGEEEDEEDEKKTKRPTSTGKTLKPKPKGREGVDRAALEKRMPALRR